MTQIDERIVSQLYAMLLSIRSKKAIFRLSASFKMQKFVSAEGAWCKKILAAK